MVPTLLERAKPQLLSALSKQKKETPGINEYVENFLKKNYFLGAITWNIWIDLRGLWLKETSHLPEDPWEVFEAIPNMFNRE